MSDINLPEEVVLEVLKKHRDIESAMKTLKLCSTVRSMSAERTRKIAKIKADADAKIKELRTAKICDHPVTRNHGDPSGNGDDSDECLICGEIF